MGQPSSCAFAREDPWLARAFPLWKPVEEGSNVTAVFMHGFSAVRILGGLALHHPRCVCVCVCVSE